MINDCIFPPSYVVDVESCKLRTGICRIAPLKRKEISVASNFSRPQPPRTYVNSTKLKMKRGPEDSNCEPEAKRRELSDDTVLSRFRDGLFDGAVLDQFTKSYAASEPCEFLFTFYFFLLNLKQPNWLLNAVMCWTSDL